MLKDVTLTNFVCEVCMKTSDGIELEQWRKVEDIAFEIAEFSLNGKDDTELLDKLYLLLSELEEGYGRLPSILATKADYTNDEVLELSLLKEAYVNSLEIGDHKNASYISVSIAEYYVGKGKFDLVNFWVDSSKKLLLNYSDDFLLRSLADIDKSGGL